MAGPLGEEESHPSFGWAQANKVQSTGIHLFDSDVKHSHYVILRVGQAARSRSLNRDWIREAPGPNIVEVAMSMAQWGALVSSFGSSGVPVTIERVHGERIDQPPHEPRLAHSVAEVEGAVDKLMETIREHAQAVADAHERKAGRREMAELIRGLESAVRNAVPNVRFAADSLTEHVENVVTKARYDIEAAAQMAASRGVAAGVAPLLPGSETE